MFHSVSQLFNDDALLETQCSICVGTKTDQKQTVLSRMIVSNDVLSQSRPVFEPPCSSSVRLLRSVNCYGVQGLIVTSSWYKHQCKLIFLKSIQNNISVVSMYLDFVHKDETYSRG